MEAKESVSTQQFVDVEDIKDGVIVLKSGGLRRVIMVSGTNFELKSEEEQNIIIGSYQNFLNTLDFSVQIIIHSRRLNIEGYLKTLSDRQNEELNELLKNQIAEYIEFIRSFVSQNEIMTKTFFVVVPYDGVDISQAAKKGILSKIPFFAKFAKKEQDKTNQEIDFSERLTQLNQRTEQVVIGLEQIGLRAVSLNDEELIELFYNLYNPQAIEKKDLKIAQSG